MKIKITYLKGKMLKNKVFTIQKSDQIWEGIDKFIKNDIIQKNKIKKLSFKYEKKEPKSQVGERILKTISKGLKLSKKLN